MNARSASSTAGYGTLLGDDELDLVRRVAKSSWFRSSLLRQILQAEDLAQEILLQWVVERDRYADLPTEERLAILSKIASNVVQQQIRAVRTDKRRLQVEAHQFSSPAGGEGDQDIGAEVERTVPSSSVSHGPELALAIDDCLAALPDRQRQVALAIHAGFTQVEIAKDLGLNRETVGQDVVRIRKLFANNGLAEFLK